MSRPSGAACCAYPFRRSERRLVYLAFDDQPALLQVWADLLATADAHCPTRQG